MSDDISIPQPGPGPVRTSFTHSYRARRTGMDTGTRRLFIAAGALGFVLVAGMAAWSLMGHRAAGVPVIEADGRPLRVKPENPGGMSAIGAGDSVLSSSDSGTGDMGPAAEKPDPQALRAQRQVAAPPAAPTPASPAGPIQQASIATPAPTLPPPAVKANPPARSPSTGTMVQLASLDSEQGAAAEWQRLSKKMPDLLADRRPVVQRAEAGGKEMWRVRTGGFADMADATQFCQRLRAKGAACSIANF